MGATPWDGEVLAAELDDQRGPRAFVHEPGGFEPILQQQGGETFLCVNDHLGMPKDLVSADGLVVWTAAHSAYGRVIAVDADLAAKARYGESASGTAGARGTATGIESPFRLLGQVADEDAEIGWTRFRCFDAETGRWLSPDPLGIDGGSMALLFPFRRAQPPNGYVKYENAAKQGVDPTTGKTLLNSQSHTAL